MFSKKGRPLRFKGICPRCGKPISYFQENKVGDRVYVFAVHYHGYKIVRGQIIKKVTKCYLGPKDSYRYVSKMHSKEGLKLKGLVDPDRVFDYIDALFLYIEREELNKETAKELINRLEHLLKRLKEKIELQNL